MEFVLNTSLLLGACLLSIDHKQRQGNGFFGLYLLAVFVSSFIVRQNFSNDIGVYSDWLATSFWQNYLYTEPIAWAGLRFIYEIFQDVYITWIVADLLIGLVVYKTLTKLKCPKYVFFLVIASFPFVLGSQNVFRQHLAAVLFLYALTSHNSIRALLITAMSALSHNMAVLYAPLIFMTRTHIGGRLMSLGYPLWLFIAPVALYIFRDFKSRAATGSNTEILYILFLLALLFLFTWIKGFRIPVKSDYVGLAFFGLINGLAALLFLGSAQVERIFLFSVFVLLPFAALEFDNHLKPKVFGRIFLILIYGAPSFMGGAFAALANIS